MFVRGKCISLLSKDKKKRKRKVSRKNDDVYKEKLRQKKLIKRGKCLTWEQEPQATE